MDKTQLNICLVTGDFPSFTETFVTTKALELAGRGHRITVIKNFDAGSINKSHLSQVEKAGIRIISFKLPTGLSALVRSGLKNPKELMQSFSISVAKFKEDYKNLLQAKLVNEKFDIVHYEFTGLAVDYLQTINKIECPVIVSCRGTAEKVKPLTDKTRAGKLINLFGAVDAIHCVSADMANTVSQFNADQSKIFINRPSIDANVFKRSSVYEEPNGATRFLSIGRFTFQKGYLLGLMAMKIVKESGLHFTWTIVGEGPLIEETIYHIHALGLQDDIVLAGRKNRDEVLQLYNETDVFVLCSVYEGIANVCLEAMSMELPVVATKSGGMEEVIDHSENGMLSDVYNAQQLAGNLITVAADFNFRKQLGKNGRQTVLDSFTLQRQVNVFEEKYYQLQG